MLNIPNNLQEAVDILKHCLSSEERQAIIEYPEDKRDLFLLKTKDYIEYEWPDPILRPLIKTCGYETRNELLVEIISKLWDELKLKTIIGTHIKKRWEIHNRKDSVDMRLISAINKWVIIGFSNKNWLPEYTSQAGNYLIGYVVNDHEAGLKALISYWAIKDNDKLFLTRDIIFQDRVFWVITAEAVKKTYFETLSNTNISELNLPISPDNLDGYFLPKYEELRNIKFLDPFRHPDYPDDIIITMDYSKVKSNMINILNHEYMWGRLEEIISDRVFLCMLLNTSPFFPQMKKGTMISVNYVQSDDGNDLICDVSKHLN